MVLIFAVIGNILRMWHFWEAGASAAAPCLDFVRFKTGSGLRKQFLGDSLQLDSPPTRLTSSTPSSLLSPPSLHDHHRPTYWLWWGSRGRIVIAVAENHCVIRLIFTSVKPCGNIRVGVSPLIFNPCTPVIMVTPDNQSLINTEQLWDIQLDQSPWIFAKFSNWVDSVNLTPPSPFLTKNEVLIIVIISSPRAKTTEYNALYYTVM